MHTKRCGMAKNEKCVCACKGARHQELTKKAAPEAKKQGPIDHIRLPNRRRDQKMKQTEFILSFTLAWLVLVLIGIITNAHFSGFTTCCATFLASQVASRWLPIMQGSLGAVLFAVLLCIAPEPNHRHSTCGKMHPSTEAELAEAP